MSTASTSLRTALCLPQPLVNALSTGEMVVSLSRGLLRGLNRQFTLCPVDSASVDSIGSMQTKLWAKVEGCGIHNEPEALDVLAQLTIWGKDQLAQILKERPHFFLAYLRVYELEDPIEIERDRLPSTPIDDFGTFINLPKSVSVPLINPVLDDIAFKERHQQLIHLKPPKYPKLLELQRQLNSWKEEGAISLNHDLQTILGWNPRYPRLSLDLERNWIQDIATVGYSSDGHSFEKLVRRSLIYLGFRNSLNNPKASLDPDATGGAGGIDVYAERPFSLVGECKASKSENVPNKVAHQLVFLGQTHIGTDSFNQSTKVLFVAGKLTKDAEQGAIENQMNVMRPETLQRLVELKAKHPGSIDLMALKPCLESSPYGEESDYKINKFIDATLEQLNIRSTLIEIVKTLENTGITKISNNTISGAYQVQNGHHHPLNESQIWEILIELSSPLAGHLGRKKGDDGSDRFYFLRDLIVE